jgi:NAD(P)H-dependent FMN reductase
MKVLALSGSLRAASINTALLRASVRLAPPHIKVSIFSGMGALPLFNPDLELLPPSQIVAFHSEIATCDVLLIASPEYAHGVTGTIKNALDWLVSFEPFVYKPVAVLNASPRARHADSALRETLWTMSAHIVAEASVNIPLLGAQLDEDAMVASATVSHAIRDVLTALHEAFVSRQGQEKTGADFGI